MISLIGAVVGIVLVLWHVNETLKPPGGDKE